MRWGGFIFGGLVGAAAAVYFSKNNRPKLMNAVNWNQAIDKAGQFAQSAKGMWDSTSMIRNVINKNPEVKQEVEQIMEESQPQSIHPN